jgi:hypothetical protein
MSKNSFLKLMTFWPPFFGAGIKVDHISNDFRYVQVSMKLKFWNKNYVNTHYGGSLYSMADPFYMLMLLENLGKEYIVWDKSAQIRFKKPGKGKVTAEFKLNDEDILAIIDNLKINIKVEPTFIVEIKNEQGEIVAIVEKVLYIKKK